MVLLVDDDMAVLDVGAKMLKVIGYEVVIAGTGKKAIEIFNESGQDIALVVLDLSIPDMTGEEIFERIREMDKDSRILISSGYPLHGRIKKMLDQGCNGFLQKPFSIEQLKTKIHEILGR